MSGFRAQRRMFTNPLVALVVVAVLALSLVPAPAAAQFSGAVVAWGNNGNGQTNVPAGLRDVDRHRRRRLSHPGAQDGRHRRRLGGTITSTTTVPAGLSDVVAIAAGAEHTVALKADGTVVAWGGTTRR